MMYIVDGSGIVAATAVVYCEAVHWSMPLGRRMHAAHLSSKTLRLILTLRLGVRAKVLALNLQFFGAPFGAILGPLGHWK